MQLVDVQVLRAVAALSVAIGHAQAFVGINAASAGTPFERSHLLPWGAGVDLFFVISGFIMVIASDKLFASPAGGQLFLWRRLKRIVPLYWAALALILLKTWLQGRPVPDAASLVTSFLFVPWDALGKGEARPIYELGWTLNYEMFFYACFALFIGFRREVAVGLLSLAMGGLVLFSLLAPPGNLQLATWTQPIILEFVIGMGLGLAYRRGIVLPAVVRLIMGAGAILILLADPLRSALQVADWITPNDLNRVAGWGLASAALLAAVVLRRPVPRSENTLTRFGVALGDASYALYLLHPLVMGPVAVAWLKLGLYPVLGGWPALAISVVASVAVSLAVYRWFERPLLQASASPPQPRAVVAGAG